jgi:xylulokinase
MAIFLGIDVGTTAIKATIIDSDGSIVAHASGVHETTFLGGGRVEQDPEQWWQLTLRLLARLAADLPNGAMSAVAAVAVSSQAPSVIALDRRGSVLRPAMIWMDRRADRESRELEAQFGQEWMLEHTGNRVDPFFVAPKLLWLRRREPELLDAASAFVQVNGYLVLRLTGVLSMDDQHASLLGLIDPDSAGGWPAELMDAIGVTPEQFPPTHPATAVVGTVSASAASHTGLAAGTPVAAGTVDSAAAAIEAGVTDPGQAVEMTGTSTVVAMPVEARQPIGEFVTMASPVDGHWYWLAAMVSSGACLTWLGGLFSGASDVPAMLASAAATAPGSDGVIFHPYMLGERSPVWDTDARGAFVGLSLSTGRAELTRAVLEGTAFSLRHNLEVAADRGVRLTELRTVGEPSSSDVWNQIKADVTGIPIVRMRASKAPVGSALVAVAAMTTLAEVTARVRERLVEERRFLPDPSNRELYDRHYLDFRQAAAHPTWRSHHPRDGRPAPQ